MKIKVEHQIARAFIVAPFDTAEGGGTEEIRAEFEDPKLRKVVELSVGEDTISLIKEEIDAVIAVLRGIQPFVK